jgi:ectoine hydroxylase
MRCFSLVLPLERNDLSNGPFTVIPGSHFLYWSSPTSDRVYSSQENFSDQKEGVPTEEAICRVCDMTGTEPMPVLCSPGDVILFDCNLLHKSDPIFEAGRSRVNLYFVINSVENKLQNPFSCGFARPEQMGHREDIVLV